MLTPIYPPKLRLWVYNKIADTGEFSGDKFCGQEYRQQGVFIVLRNTSVEHRAPIGILREQSRFLTPNSATSFALSTDTVMKPKFRGCSSAYSVRGDSGQDGQTDGRTAEITTISPRFSKSRFNKQFYEKVVLFEDLLEGHLKTHVIHRGVATCGQSQIVDAFAQFTFFASDEQLVVCNLQGVEDDGKTTLWISRRVIP
ncbi:hypothetical protein DPMN_175576 [Dreissena polymorpha]|uniref:Alpha-type protein kinase domain-containing protein n=1 Tax=Dreissena polymorpha TaxID=45954 RepID=A0A9D4IG62_DREPO|nr:hypothetical protein DPMN_175576 [Dreissena polymorpha]